MKIQVLALEKCGGGLTGSMDPNPHPFYDLIVKSKNYINSTKTCNFDFTRKIRNHNRIMDRAIAGPVNVHS